MAIVSWPQTLWRQFTVRIKRQSQSKRQKDPDNPFWQRDTTLWVKKQDMKLLPISSPNVNRFSQFFYHQTQL